MRKGMRSKTFLNSKIWKIVKRNSRIGFAHGVVLRYICSWKGEEENVNVSQTNQTTVALTQNNSGTELSLLWQHHLHHVTLLMRIGTYLSVVRNAFQKHDCYWTSFQMISKNTWERRNRDKEDKNNDCNWHQILCLVF